ncbi:MAG: hypothetical protein WBD93_18545 [Acidobacteriaceae bacterium]
MTSLLGEKAISTRRLRGRSRRDVTVSTKITAEEFALISATSETAGRAIGEWMREVLLKEARPGSDSLSSEQLMTEIIGLQMFLTRVLSAVASGERMTREQCQDLMRNVKANKRRAAQDALAQYRNGDEEEHHG